MNTFKAVALTALAAVSSSCAHHTTPADRMPQAASVIASSISNAEEELESVRQQFSETSFSGPATEMLNGVGSDIEKAIRRAKIHLAAAEADLDADELRRSSYEALQAIQDAHTLRTMYMVAEAATK